MTRIINIKKLTWKIFSVFFWNHILSDVTFFGTANNTLINFFISIILTHFTHCSARWFEIQTYCIRIIQCNNSCQIFQNIPWANKNFNNVFISLLMFYQSAFFLSHVQRISPSGASKIQFSYKGLTSVLMFLFCILILLKYTILLFSL